MYWSSKILLFFIRMNFLWAMNIDNATVPNTNKEITMTSSGDERRISISVSSSGICHIYHLGKESRKDLRQCWDVYRWEELCPCCKAIRCCSKRWIEDGNARISRHCTAGENRHYLPPDLRNHTCAGSAWRAESGWSAETLSSIPFVWIREVE